MERYKDNTGSSGISAYEVGPDWILVQFKAGGIYTYSYKTAGKHHIEQMKNFAQRGQGLTTYINQYVKDLYE